MMRAMVGAVALFVCLVMSTAAAAGSWAYRAYEQDGVRWHTLSLEDGGFRLAFFCHGASDGIKISLRTPEPLFLPTAFSVTDRSATGQQLRLADREVIAGPYLAKLSVDQNSSYELELYHVTFYGVLARNDASFSLDDLLTHLLSARSIALTRLGEGDLGPDRPLATFDLAATEGAFDRLYDLCGAPVSPPVATGQNASR